MAIARWPPPKDSTVRDSGWYFMLRCGRASIHTCATITRSSAEGWYAPLTVDRLVGAERRLRVIQTAHLKPSSPFGPRVVFVLG